LWRRFPKHKGTRYAKNGGHDPLGPPGYAYDPSPKCLVKVRLAAYAFYRMLNFAVSQHVDQSPFSCKYVSQGFREQYVFVLAQIASL